MTALKPLQRALAGVLLVGPILLFITLRLNPAWDPSWSLPIFHFYIVTYTSLVALVVASFVLAGVGLVGDERALLVAIGFVSVAGLFVVHGISTPGVLIPNFNQAVGWSARLSLTAGAIFVALGLRDLSPEIKPSRLQSPAWVWVGLALAFALYNLVIFGFPRLFEVLAQIQIISTTIALFTAALFLWAAARAWMLYERNKRRMPLALGFALPWLALAQISQYAAPLWMASWWLYHILMLAAFVITMVALVLDYEEVRDFQLPRYFVALSVVVGVPVIGLLSEVAVRLGSSEGLRWPMFGFSLVGLAILFVILLTVVRRAGRILNERADALEEEKHWRADFTNLVVHDLKAPLTVIMASAGVLNSEQVGEISPMQRPHLERVRRSVQEIQGMIDNLLDVEKLEAGALRLTPGPVDVGEMLRESTDEMRALADAYDIQLELTLPFNLPSSMEADETLLKRVMQNLLSNSIKFTPSGGHILIEAVPTSRELTVSVIDDGPGVPPDQRERIFEKFVQVQGLERRGAGLGLAYCKLAVEVHGGHIWVEDATGGGSRFSFTLPINHQNGA